MCGVVRGVVGRSARAPHGVSDRGTARLRHRRSVVRLRAHCAAINIQMRRSLALLYSRDRVLLIQLLRTNKGGSRAAAHTRTSRGRAGGSPARGSRRKLSFTRSATRSEKGRFPCADSVAARRVPWRAAACKRLDAVLADSGCDLGTTAAGGTRGLRPAAAAPAGVLARRAVATAWTCAARRAKSSAARWLLPTPEPCGRADFTARCETAEALRPWLPGRAAAPALPTADARPTDATPLGRL